MLNSSANWADFLVFNKYERAKVSYCADEKNTG